MPLPHGSVDRLHAAAVEACLAYQRSARRRGVKLEKIMFTFEPAGEGFDLKIEENPYPRDRNNKAIIPEEEREVPGEDEPLPNEKD